MKIGILCVSDRCSRGECEDKSGPAIAECVAALSDENVYRLVPDDMHEIQSALTELSDELAADVIFTTGGTGFAPRDVTPEATRAVLDREAPGIAEAIRAASMTITPRAMLSRAVSGIRGKTLIVNLPGSGARVDRRRAACSGSRGRPARRQHAILRRKLRTWAVMFSICPENARQSSAAEDSAQTLRYTLPAWGSGSSF